MSDWELKEMILDNSEDQYPFLQYHTSLQQALSVLQKHHVTLTTQIAEIKKHEKKLQYKNVALQLEQKGKDLEKQVSKTVSLVTILHMRIASFKEYHEDCYYWKEKIDSEKMDGT
jgi:cellobiose phosphorylase